MPTSRNGPNRNAFGTALPSTNQRCSQPANECCQFRWTNARDWVRFGLLYLNNGVWQGERILPEGWTDFVSTPAPADEKKNYGGMFWLNLPPRMDRVPKDAYGSAGFMGQVTMVIPSRDMVVVRMGPSPGDAYPYLNEVIDRVLEAIP